MRKPRGKSILLITVLAAVLLLPILYSTPVMAGPPTCEDTTIEYLGKNVDGSSSNWSYEVCQSGFSLSHWVLGICLELEEHITEVGYIDSSGIPTVMQRCSEAPEDEPCWSVGTDPTTGQPGLKWDRIGGPDDECWIFYLVLDINPDEETLDWASKYDACPPTTGTITGPACEDGTCSGSLTIHKKTGGAYLGGATFTISDNATSNVVYEVTDNVSPDEDNTPGIITITGVPCGTYDITETGVPPDYVAATGSQTVTVIPDETAGPVVFENHPCGKIFGYKWYDFNHNTEWEDGVEPPLNGWTIVLTLPDSSELNAVTGNGSWEDGYYEFEICGEGIYSLREELPVDDDTWHQMFPEGGTHTVEAILPFPPEGYGPYNFGNSMSCWTIYGYKWHDLNKNGEWEYDEPALDGWQINLAGAASGINSTAITGDGNWDTGYYEFTVCDVDDIFTLSETLQAGWSRSFPETGVHQVEVSISETGPGAEEQPLNFGNWKSTPPPPPPPPPPPEIQVGINVMTVNRLVLAAPLLGLALLGLLAAARLLLRRQTRN